MSPGVRSSRCISYNMAVESVLLPDDVFIQHGLLVASSSLSLHRTTDRI